MSHTRHSGHHNRSISRHLCCETPHQRSSSHRSSSTHSRDHSRSRPHTAYKLSKKNLFKSSSSSGRTAVTPHDRNHHRVIIDDPQTDYYSSDDTSSDSKDDVGHLIQRSLLLVVHPMNGGSNTQETVTVACIVDCPSITFHADKCYKALTDSGAAISLL